jgi:hypothetical protein
VTETLQLDNSNRIVLSRDLRRAAGIPRRQRLKVSAMPGRIVLEVPEETRGKLVTKDGLKVWTGKLPEVSLEEAVDRARHYRR